jgi:hypothetical protein
MAKKNYLSYPNPEFVPTVDSLPDGTLVAYDAASQLWATFESGQIFQKDANGNWTQQHPCGCTPIVRRPNRHSQYPLIWRGNTTITIHVIMARAWIGGLEPQQDSRSTRIPEGWQVDHIDGNKFDAAVRNLRIVPAWLNHRDGGFLRKLRHKKIDPTMYAQAVLLEYFERMAAYKAEHSQSSYTHMTRTDLLQLLVGPKFTVDDSAKIMEEEMTHHMEI